MRTPIDLLYLPAYTTRSANRRADLRVYSGRKTKCTLGTTTVVALLCALLSQLGGETRAAVAPIISSIPDQVTTEDEPILRVPFTVSDADSPLALLSINASLYFNKFSPGSIIIGGAGSNRWFSIYPPPDTFGTGQATITVRDETGLSATASFRVQVNPVNDPPRFSPIPDQTALIGQMALTVPFWVNDPDTNGPQLRLTAWSSRQNVVLNSGLRLTQGTTVTNRNLEMLITTGIPTFWRGSALRQSIPLCACI